MITRRQLLAAVPAAALVTWRGPELILAQDAEIKVGFIYVGPIGDMGWTYAHDQGRLELEKNLPNVKTTYQESVPENAADAERAIRQMAQDGNKVIFTTSFGYMDPTINVAKDIETLAWRGFPFSCHNDYAPIGGDRGRQSRPERFRRAASEVTKLRE